MKPTITEAGVHIDRTLALAWILDEIIAKIHPASAQIEDMDRAQTLLALLIEEAARTSKSIDNIARESMADSNDGLSDR